MSWIEFEHAGRLRRLAVARADGGVWVGWRGGAKFFRREAAESSRSAAGSEDVRAPMTGRVVRVNASAGTSVREGEIVAVLEAMKMEYRLAAPHDGRVERVACVEGQQVDLGAVLLTVRKA